MPPMAPGQGMSDDDAAAVRPRSPMPPSGVSPDDQDTVDVGGVFQKNLGMIKVWIEKMVAANPATAKVIGNATNNAIQSGLMKAQNKAGQSQPKSSGPVPPPGQAPPKPAAGGKPSPFAVDTGRMFSGGEQLRRKSHSMKHSAQG